TDLVHDSLLGFVATRDANQFLQQRGPVLFAIDDHAMRIVEGTAIARAGLELVTASNRLAHSPKPLEQRRTEDDHFLVQECRLEKAIDASAPTSTCETKTPSPCDPIAQDVATAFPDRSQPNSFRNSFAAWNKFDWHLDEIETKAAGADHHLDAE